MGHGVGFTLELVAVVDPVGAVDEGAAGVAGGLEVLHLGLEKREFGFGNGGVLAGFLVPKKGEGLSPVTLAGEEPVAEFELDFLFAFFVFDEPVNDLLFGVFGFETIEEAGVDGKSMVCERLRERGRPARFGEREESEFALY